MLKIFFLKDGTKWARRVSNQRNKFPIYLNKVIKKHGVNEISTNVKSILESSN